MAPFLTSFDTGLMRTLSIIFTAIWLLFGNCPAKGQGTIPPRDIHHLDELAAGLDLSQEQRSAIHAIYLTYQPELNELSEAIDELERTTDDEKTLFLKVAVMNEQKKELRKRRELELQDVLTDEQLAVYTDHFSTSQVRTASFGLHNSLVCKLCNR
jgi:Spy/CpxP family protein refolding chaperone